jgi:hypothetical protein
MRKRVGPPGKRAPILVGVLVILMAVMFMMALVRPVLLLMIVVTAGGERVLCTRVETTTPITLSFTHSMFGGFVDEHYVLGQDGTLVRQAIVTGNAAAAEYYATDGRTREVANGYEIIASPFATDGLTLRVDARGDHRLIVGTTVFPLYEQLGQSTQVRLEGERTRPFQVPGTCGDSR